jgi:hypothetical protein
MNYFAGLDVSLKRTAICIVDQDGNIVWEGVTDTEPEALISWLRIPASLCSALGWKPVNALPGCTRDFRKADYRSFVLRPGTQKA